jgi:hypothetical protein
LDFIDFGVRPPPPKKSKTLKKCPTVSRYFVAKHNI